MVWMLTKGLDVDYVPKNCGGVKKKPMIIFKEFIFFRLSFNKRRQRLARVPGFTLK